MFVCLCCFRRACDADARAALGRLGADWQARLDAAMEQQSAAVQELQQQLAHAHAEAADLRAQLGARTEHARGEGRRIAAAVGEAEGAIRRDERETVLREVVRR